MPEDPIPRFLGYGVELAGASVGFAVEFLQAVPAGAGGPIAVAATSVLKDISVRFLSHREKARVSAAGAFAIERIGDRLLAGYNPRSDDFFRELDNGNSSGKELLEAVLVKARDSFQEKKVRHFGLFYANLVFADSVSAQTAHYSLRQLARLTYRQLCLLALVGRSGSLEVEALRRPTHDSLELESLKREEMDLHSSDLGTLGLLLPRGPWTDELSLLGKVLYDLAGLQYIDDDDKNAVATAIASLTGKSIG